MKPNEESKLNLDRWGTVINAVIRSGYRLSGRLSVGLSVMGAVFGSRCGYRLSLRLSVRDREIIGYDDAGEEDDKRNDDVKYRSPVTLVLRKS
ncbi:unnamed protein product [Microthlaspi erraticum]|uniref:Uncharacterized protein n=1 Tax=Microthlaspi erraticum TaxID=1685480 RepID=A0A6D2KSS0_9BRAS|nr:unnamed protein product [Microthlaspi erraticum]